jgi:hypothetical protein
MGNERGARQGGAMNLMLAAIKQAIDDLAKAKGIKDYRVSHKRNPRGELVIALIVADREGPLSKVD